MKSMNIIEFSESLQARMKQELDTLNTDHDEIGKIGKAITFVRELINELKVFTRNYKFETQIEEIQFFKEIKPVFLSQYFYYKKVFAIRLFDSFKDTKSRQENYNQLLQRLEVFVQKNLEFYEYCMSGDTSMDTRYFTRQNHNHKSVDRDESFSNGFDTILAKILAIEMVKKYILYLLGRTDLTQPTLTWTGSKTDLTELIYALHSSEVFNHGKVDIKQIASAFETSFNVNLGNYYRTFQELRLRKTGQSNFLDEMKKSVIQRMSSFSK